MRNTTAVRIPFSSIFFSSDKSFLLLLLYPFLFHLSFSLPFRVIQASSVHPFCSPYSYVISCEGTSNKFELADRGTTKFKFFFFLQAFILGGGVNTQSLSPSTFVLTGAEGADGHMYRLFMASLRGT